MRPAGGLDSRMELARHGASGGLATLGPCGAHRGVDFALGIAFWPCVAHRGVDFALGVTGGFLA